MFDPSELLRAGIQSRAGNYQDWKHPACAYRITSTTRPYHDHLYKHRESVPLLLAAFRAKQRSG